MQLQGFCKLKNASLNPGFQNRSITTKTAATKRLRNLSIKILLFTDFMIKTNTTIRVATLVPTEIAKTFTRPQPLFKTYTKTTNQT